MTHVLAVDLGGTKVAAALVRSDGTLLEESVTRRPTGREATREQITASIRDAAESALRALPAGGTVDGVGIGSAGPIDRPTGAVFPINLPQVHGLVIADVLDGLAPGARRHLALDGTCIALGEHRFGALRGTGTALAMVVSTGIGGGMIVDGRPATGQSGNAGHIGQIRVRDWDAADPDAGTLEGVAAGPGTVAWARAQGWGGTTGEELGAAYRAGDEIAVRAVARSADAVGQAIADVSTLLDLEAVAIAGGFVAVADDYIDRVIASVAEHALLPYAAAVRVTGSSLEGDGPILGAAALALAAPTA